MRMHRPWWIMSVVSMLACSKGPDSFVVLNVDSANEMTRAEITSLKVTVAGESHDYPVHHTLPATLGIETTKTGSLAISVIGIGLKALGSWTGNVVLTQSQTVRRNVVLQCDDIDCDATTVNLDASTDSGDAALEHVGGSGAGGSGGQPGMGGAGGYAGSAAASGVAGVGVAGAGGQPGSADAGSADGSSCATDKLQTDSFNCGACGYICVNGRSCVGGRCTPAWLPVTTTNAPTARIRHSSSHEAQQVCVPFGGHRDKRYRQFGGYPSVRFASRSLAERSIAQSESLCTCVIGVRWRTGKVQLGGLSDCSNGASVGPALEVYDPATNVWTVSNILEAADASLQF